MAIFGFAIDIGLVALFIYGLISLVAFIPASIDIIKSKRDVKYKIVWLFICLILQVIGVAIYYFVEKKKGKLTG